MAAHGQLVSVGGVQVDARIADDLRAIMRKFKVKPTAGYAPTGHAAGGEHPLGLATDLVPDTAKGGTWADVARLAKFAEPSQNKPISTFRWVGYNGDSGHGDPAHAGGNAHLHLSWNHNGIRTVSTLKGNKDGGLVKGLPDIGDVIPGFGTGVSTGDITGAAGDVATAVPKAIVTALASALGEKGARILLYLIFVAGGATLAYLGIARTAGLRASDVTQVAGLALTKGKGAGAKSATKGATA